MSTRNQLVLSFDPRTIEHLGVRMYSHVPNAVAELVANAYDADATRVEVRIGRDRSIAVVDNGHGMSRDEVADKYLRIGRNRRQAEDSEMTESGRRRVSGKKGLGKLALFGIGRVVKVTTTRDRSPDATVITMSYQALIESEGAYHPDEEILDVDKATHGTEVVLTDLRRKTPVDVEKLADSLARLFNYADEDFSLLVVDSKSGREIEVSRNRLLESLDQEFSWRFPDDFTSDDLFLISHDVSGSIISTSKPLRNVPRGITLYADGRMVNEPEFFGASESSHAYAYLTGHLDIDFVDAMDEDVIATDRRALVWDSSDMEKLREALAELLTRVGREWRERRSDERRSRSREMIGITMDGWVGSIRSDESRVAVEKILENVNSEDLDLTADQQAALIGDIQRLAPPYADYVWRRLHPEIQEASRREYERGAYHVAIIEAIKVYTSSVAVRSHLSRDKEQKLFNEAFGDKGRLKVFEKHRRAGVFSEATAKNMENGQRSLSTGIHSAFRNAISHEQIDVLQESGALTYEDCLDALTILSYLMRRLDDAELCPNSEASDVS